MAGTCRALCIGLITLLAAACGGGRTGPIAAAPAPASERAPTRETAPPRIDAPEPAPAPLDLPPAEPTAPTGTPSDSTPVADEPPVTWDIEVAPYESHARVEYFVGRFTGGARGAFARALVRQSRYAPMIHERLRKGGLPEDMIYLPLIESWYDPHAYSRAAAVGMWQFMTTTARGLRMRVDWWVDERRDPVRATEGAVLFLNKLRDDFGSVYLAAAAYNGGPGRISRGLVKHAEALEGAEGEEQFFALAESDAMRAETKDYVPKLIAAALVGKEPGKYGIEVDPVSPFEWDSVSVPAATPLAAVAKAARVPVDTLLAYNGQILRGMTPPTGSALWLKVPRGTQHGYGARFAALEPAERAAVRRVTTVKGDAMVRLAKKHGLTAKQLAAYNPSAVRLKSGNLRAGQRILVPRLDVVRAARDVPDPKIERYGTSVRRHVVKRGETLSAIARKNGITVARLKSLNRLKGDRIRVGQSLRVR